MRKRKSGLPWALCKRERLGQKPMHYSKYNDWWLSIPFWTRNQCGSPLLLRPARWDNIFSFQYFNFPENGSWPKHSLGGGGLKGELMDSWFNEKPEVLFMTTKTCLQLIGRSQVETPVLSVAGIWGMNVKPWSRMYRVRYPNNLDLQLCISHDELLHKRKHF